MITNEQAALARRIAVNYPVRSDYVAAILARVDWDETKARKLLDAGVSLGLIDMFCADPEGALEAATRPWYGAPTCHE